MELVDFAAACGGSVICDAENAGTDARLAGIRPAAGGPPFPPALPPKVTKSPGCEAPSLPRPDVCPTAGNDAVKSPLRQIGKAGLGVEEAAAGASAGWKESGKSDTSSEGSEALETSFVSARRLVCS